MKKLKELWQKFKTWVLQTALPWLLKAWTKIKPWFIKNWFMIINYFIIFMSYNVVYGKEDVILAEFLLGFWMFLSVGYAGYLWFKKI